MNTKGKIILAALSIISLSAFFGIKGFRNSEVQMEEIEIKPLVGSIAQTVSTSGTVLPKNRLELKPSVSGRIEKVFIEEGDTVTVGQVMAHISSTDRAALIDSARLQGEDALRYWENIYKEIPIISPVNGTVIVRDVEPGQTVSSSDHIFIISDRLIIQAQFDETDIGKIEEGQTAQITLDSLPDISVKGEVSHIYYESQMVNNVTVYFVNITPESVPAEFRSGMSASIEIDYETKNKVIMVPLDAVSSDRAGDYVLIKKSENGKPEKRAVALGVSNDTEVEISEGLTPEDTLVVYHEKIKDTTESSGTNPFVQERSEERRPPHVEQPGAPAPQQDGGNGPGPGGPR